MRITFLIFLIGISFIVKSQKYIPLSTNNSEWIVEIESIDGDGGESEFYKNRYFISGDTTINDTLYTEISTELSNRIYTEGYLYQDTVEQKVFFTQPHWEQDFLLFDFNLEVGQSYEFYGFDELKVVSIDSIEVNNSYRKRIIFDKEIFCLSYPRLERVSFVEGIGSNAGLLPENYLGLITSYLTCYKENGETYYPFDINEFGCDLNTMTIVSVNNINLQNINIYPNPYKDFITLDLELLNQNYALLKVYDILGKEVFADKIFETNYIDLSFLNKGIYLFKLEIDSKDLFTRTVIKL